MRSSQQHRALAPTMVRLCVLIFCLTTTLFATCAAAPADEKPNTVETTQRGFKFEGALALGSAAAGAGICYFWVRRKRDSFTQMAENASISASSDGVPSREIIVIDIDAAETKATGIGAGRAAAAAMQEQRSDAEDAAANESRTGKTRSKLFVWQVGDAQLHLPRFSFENNGDSRNNSMTNLATTIRHEESHSEASSQSTGSTGENERW